MSGGDDEAPRLGRPTENTPLRPIVELTPQWATTVARAFLDVVAMEEQQGLGPPKVDECWVGEDLAIYLRYRGGANHEISIGARITNSHIDPTSAGYALDPREQAFWFLRDMEAPPPAQWSDSLGYGWFDYRWYADQPTPHGSWQYVVEDLPRIVTVREWRANGKPE